MAHVQSTGATAIATTAAKAYTSNVTIGNLLIACVAFANAETFTSVTDTLLNVWNLAGGEASDGSDKSRVYYAISNSSAADTVTLTTSGGAFKTIQILEYSVTTVFDVANQVNGNDTAPTSPSITVAQANSLLFGYACCTGGTGSAGSGYAIRDTTNGNVTEEKTASAGAQTVVAAMSPSGLWNMHGLAFNSGPSGGNVVRSSVPFMSNRRI